MYKRCLAAVIAVCAFPAQSQPVAPPVSIQPAVDTPQQREVLRKFAVCLAQARPAWARGMLSHPYLSSAQASAAAEALAGRDTCLRTREKEMTFRTSTMVGSLAEYFVRAEIPRIDPKRLASGLATAAPLNASEDFALCLAAHNVGAATDLALSEPGSAEESKAVAEVGAFVQPCANPGEKLTVDAQALRALVSNALYRGMMAAER